MISLIQSAVLAMIVLSSSCNNASENHDSLNSTDTIVISAGNKLRDLGEFRWGFNSQMMRGPSWQAPGFIEQVKRLNPQLIRYPGGTVASYWDWSNGWLKEDLELISAWKNIPKSPIKLEDLKWACEQTGAMPVFVLNMIHSDVHEQLEMLRHARKLGLPVKYVEFDNEVYLGRDVYAERFEDADAYVKECEEWRAVILKDFPDVRFGYAGHATRGQGSAATDKYGVRSQNWNRSLKMSGVKNTAIILHNYSGSGLKYLSGNKGKSDLHVWQETFEDAGSQEVILGIPFSTWTDMTDGDLSYFGQESRIWVTEYNMFEKQGIVAGTWTHGLYALTQTILMASHPQVEILCYHNLVTSAQFGAIHYSDDAFHKALKPIPTQLYGLSAAGEALSMFGEALRGSTSLLELRLGNNTMNKTFRGRKYPSITGVIFNKDHSTDVLLMNLSAEEKLINLEGYDTTNCSYRSIQSGPTDQVAFEKDITRRSETGMPSSLPPYSVTLISGL